MPVPPRPPIVMRVPDKEKKQERENKNDSLNTSTIKTQSHPVLLKQPDVNSADFCFTIYTNIKKCRHSIDILEDIEKYRLVCNNYDVSQITNLPKWITVTPVVVFEGDGYCGDLAFEFIESLYKFINKANMGNHESIESTEISPPKNFHDRIKKNDTSGSSFSKAFASPSNTGEDDTKYNMSSEDMMKNVSSLLRR